MGGYRTVKCVLKSTVRAGNFHLSPVFSHRRYFILFGFEIHCERTIYFTLPFLRVNSFVFLEIDLPICFSGHQYTDDSKVCFSISVLI